MNDEAQQSAAITIVAMFLAAAALAAVLWRWAA